MTIIETIYVGSSDDPAAPTATEGDASGTTELEGVKTDVDSPTDTTSVW